MPHFSTAVFFTATTAKKQKRKKGTVLLLVPVSMETKDMLADEQASRSASERERISALEHSLRRGARHS